LSANSYNLWHDRAVFHFLTDPADREKYLANLNKTLIPGGHVVMATFAHDGPEQCSGLPVERYDSDKLQLALGSDYKLINSYREQHQTPSGHVQNFLYAHLSRRDLET